MAVPEQAVFHQRGDPGCPGRHRGLRLAAAAPRSTTPSRPREPRAARGHRRPAARRPAVRTGHSRRCAPPASAAADGAGDGLTADRGVDGTQPGAVAVPDPATAVDLLRTFDAVRRDARLLAVVDVSGSMAAPVPGAGGSTRLELALRAAAAGMAAVPRHDRGRASGPSPRTCTGGGDHRELVPIAPAHRLRARRTGGARPGDGVSCAPVPNGGTGLYDTTLAAVRAVRAGWDPAPGERRRPAHRRGGHRRRRDRARRAARHAAHRARPPAGRCR